MNHPIPHEDEYEQSSLSLTRIFAEAGLNRQMGEMAHRVIFKRFAQVAREQKRWMGVGNSLPTMELVDDAVLRLLRSNPEQWNDRLHILATAAQAIEQLTIDHLRRKNALKRGGGVQINSLSLSDPLDPNSISSEETERVQAALMRLQEHDTDLATIVRLRAFGELSFVEIAKEMDLDADAVGYRYRKGLAWLHKEIQRGES